MSNIEGNSFFRHKVKEMNEKLSFKMGVEFPSSIYMG